MDVSFLKSHKIGKMYFYVMGKDEDENILKCVELIKTYKLCSNATLYLISEREEADVLGSYLEDIKGVYSGRGLKFYRVEPSLDMIYNLLYNDGKMLFDKAVKVDDGYKKIGAVIVGMGRYGRNMVRTLSWHLQMDGYVSEINAFDINESAQDEFTMQYPELIDESINGKIIPGEAQYNIKIHSGVDVKNIEFYRCLEKIDVISFVFISLGSDGLNLYAAKSIRSWAARNGQDPVIQVMSYNEEIGEAMKKHEKP